MMRTRAALVLAAGVVVVTPQLSSAAVGTDPLTSKGVGPLTLGMSKADAVKTGWLKHPGKGCELASPRPVTYDVVDPHHTTRIKGTAEFVEGKLVNLSFSKGVRTTNGVTVGQTSVRKFASKMEASGLKVRATYDGQFGGIFVSAKKDGKQAFGGFGNKLISTAPVTLLAIPNVSVCE